MTLKEEIKNLSIGDWLGVGICISILVGYLVGLGWWAYFSDQPNELANILINSNSQIIGSLEGAIYFLLIIIGLMSLSEAVNKIAMFFFPKSEKEKLIERKKKEFIKKYPIELAKQKVKYFEKKLELEKIKKKINKLEEEINEK